MFLRHTKRKKDGKEHRYWSIVENRRIGGGRVVRRNSQLWNSKSWRTPPTPIALP